MQEIARKLQHKNTQNFIDAVHICTNVKQIVMIEQLLPLKKINFRLFIASLIVFGTVHLTLTQENSSCINGGLEQGTFVNWSGEAGYYDGCTNLTYNNINAGVNLLGAVNINTAPRFSIVNQGVDQYVPINKVFHGSNALRIGDNTSNPAGTNDGGYLTRANYNFQVTSDNANFKMNYAVVLQNPNHVPNKNSWFWARIFVTTANGEVLIYETGRKTAQTDDEFFQIFENFEYRDWDCFGTDLSQYIGMNARAEFTISNCAFAGHFAYAYIDALCIEETIDLDFSLDKREYCLGENIIFDGSNTIGVTSYYITVEESDANYGRPNPASEVMYLFPNTTPDVLNLYEYINQPNTQNFNFQCNMYYRIKLVGMNSCTDWVEDVQLIYISCPVVNMQNLYCYDCDHINNGETIQLGPTNTNNYDFLWSPVAGLDNAFSSNPIHTLGSVNYPHIYNVNVTDKYDCSINQTVKINCKPKAQISVITNESDCCGGTFLSLTGTNYTSIGWSNGESNTTIIEAQQPGFYYAIVSSECGFAFTNIIQLSSVDLAPYPRYWTDLSINNFMAGSTFHYVSSHNNLNSQNVFFIANIENPEPQYGEYKATHYRLQIFNRWGELFKEIEGEISDCRGFNQYAIQWDGFHNGGKVQEGLYNARLQVKNCANREEWIDVPVQIPYPYCSEWNENDCNLMPFANFKGPQCNSGWPKKHHPCTQVTVGGEFKFIFPIYIWW